MEKEVLSFIEWLPRINERTTFILLSINNGKDINEEDWDLLKKLHRQYWGECEEHPATREEILAIISGENVKKTGGVKKKKKKARRRRHGMDIANSNGNKK